MNLSAFRGPEAWAVLQGIPRQPRCLIQGITAPDNGTSLRRFLNAFGAAPQAVDAIDIVDVDAVARHAGHPLTDVAFRIADAADLRDWNTGSVDVLAQDHLLNCAPHSAHPQIVAEAARILSRDGVWILNFSVDPRIPGGEVISLNELERRIGLAWEHNAYCLADLTDSASRLTGVHGCLVEHGKDDRQTLITAPHGNFEFFFGFEALARLVHLSGLKFAQISSSREYDSQGVSCHRFRTLVTHSRQ